jgi:hypothetical protein
VVPWAELVPHLPDLSLETKAREGPEDQGGGLVVAVANAAPGFAIRNQPDYREAEGAVVGGGRSSARAPDEHRIALLAGGVNGVREARPEGVAPGHPDVAGGGRDRDGRRTLPRGHLREDHALVAVGRRSPLETLRQK